MCVWKPGFFKSGHIYFCDWSQHNNSLTALYTITCFFFLNGQTLCLNKVILGWIFAVNVQCPTVICNTNHIHWCELCSDTFKKSLKNVFWAPEFSIQNVQDTLNFEFLLSWSSSCHSVCTWFYTIYKSSQVIRIIIYALADLCNLSYLG